MADLHKWTLESNDEAVTHFDRAIDLDPNLPRLWRRGSLLCPTQAAPWTNDYAKETAEAERLARRAIELGPDDAVALCTAGFAFVDIVCDFEDG